MTSGSGKKCVYMHVSTYLYWEHTRERERANMNEKDECGKMLTSVERSWKVNFLYYSYSYCLSEVMSR